MRFMTWNINRGTPRDLPRVWEEGVDVAVLCEASAEPPAAGPAVQSWFSVGDLGDRSLVLAGLTSAVEPVPYRDGSGRWTIAGKTEQGIGILGIWTCPAEGGRYGPELVASLDAHEEFLRERPCIVAGDFNVSPAGTEDARTGVLRSVFERLDRLGYSSAYHSHTGEGYAAETVSTYFHRYRQDEGFHIDFVFTHGDLTASIRSVDVGRYDDWVARRDGVAGNSDHVPLVVDLDIE